jgi:hypothetical protein
MQNMERRKFEDSWKDAFNQAELSPTENVWTNIELDLEKEKGNRLKRRLLFYQSLAAASLIFTLGIGFYVFNNSRHTSDALAIQSRAQSAAENGMSPSSDAQAGNLTKEQSVDNGRRTPANGETNSSVNKSRSSNAAQNDNALAKNKKHDDVLEKRSHANSKAEPPKESSSPLQATNQLIAYNERQNEALFSPIPDGKRPPIFHLEKIQLKINDQPEPDPVVLMMARLNLRENEIGEQQEKEKKQNKKNENENVWTSLGFAAGSFNTVNGGNTVSMANSDVMNSTSFYSQTSNSNTLASVAEKEAKASGMTYSMGINIGTKLSERWVLQGGLNYLAQTSEYTQQVLVGDRNFTTFRPANYNDYKNSLPQGDARAENLVSTAPYQVNNDVRYLSVPLQAGYLIVNRKFGVQLNGGVSTDLFLQNIVTATANGEEVDPSKTNIKVDPSKADIGESSAFRQVNLSGLVGTELSYRIGQHYRIALNPGVRYPFSSIYKSDDYRATRLSFDLGLRFRYIFR